MCLITLEKKIMIIPKLNNLSNIDNN
jgi:hypothetical protein